MSLEAPTAPGVVFKGSAKRAKNKNGATFYGVYIMECTDRDGHSWAIERRFSEFVLLRNFLIKDKCVKVKQMETLPHGQGRFPVKGPKSTDSKVMQERLVALDNWLGRVLKLYAENLNLCAFFKEVAVIKRDVGVAEPEPEPAALLAPAAAAAPALAGGVPEGEVGLAEVAQAIGSQKISLQQQLRQLDEQHSRAREELPRRHEEQMRELERRQQKEVEEQRRVQREEVQELQRQLEELQRREAAVEERQRAEQLRRQREAEQAKLVTKFMRERFADEATARRCLKQVDWGFAAAVALYMPPVPDSPVSGRSFDKTSFKGGYDKATVPKGQLQLGGLLMKLIEAYCAKEGIPYYEDEGEHFFEQLQAEAMTNRDDPIAVMAQRMWTSALQLRGREFCFILNDAVREDAPALAGTMGKIARSINQLCVTAGCETVHPPDFVCYRGGGFDDAYRSFFVPGRAFRQPAYLATSFSRDVALVFLRRSTMPVKVLWLIRIDPERKCVHVNLVQKSNVAGEQEYLFAPYSVFKVIEVKWGAGTDEDPYIVELIAAPDNKAEPEDLESAPWS
jgi:hypothetical protein